MKPGTVLAALLLIGWSASAKSPAPIRAGYLEARSHHIYTCGCLASGETVTDGREAILAWRFDEGEFRGASLEGAKAVAVVVADHHLAAPSAPRRTTLYIDAPGSAAGDAVVELLAARYAEVLGEIMAVRRTPVRFRKDAGGASVEVSGAVRLLVRPADLDRDAHLGSYLWYRPFVPTVSEALATTLRYEYSGGDFDRHWARYEPAIAAYLGTVALPAE